MKLGFLLCLLLIGAIADFTLIDYDTPVTYQKLEPCSVYAFRLDLPQERIPTLDIAFNVTTPFAIGTFSYEYTHIDYLPTEDDVEFLGEVYSGTPTTVDVSTTLPLCNFQLGNYVVIRNTGDIAFSFNFSVTTDPIPESRVFNILLRPEDKEYNFINSVPSNGDLVEGYLYLNISLANDVTLDTLETLTIFINHVAPTTQFSYYVSTTSFYDFSSCSNSDLSSQFSPAFEFSSCGGSTYRLVAIQVPLNGRFSVIVDHERQRIYDQISPISITNMGKIYTGNYEGRQIFQLDLPNVDLSDKSLSLNLDNTNREAISLSLVSDGLCEFSTQFLCDASGELGCRYVIESCELAKYVEANRTTLYLVTDAQPVVTFRVSSNLLNERVESVNVGDSKLAVVNSGETRHYQLNNIPDLSCDSEEVVNVHIYSDIPTDRVLVTLKTGKPSSTRCESTQKYCSTVSGEVGYGCSLQLLPCEIDKLGTEWYLSIQTNEDSDNKFFHSSVTYTINTEVVQPYVIEDKIQTTIVYGGIYKIFKIKSDRIPDFADYTTLFSPQRYSSEMSFQLYYSYGKIQTEGDDCFPEGGDSVTEDYVSLQLTKCSGEEDLYIVVLPLYVPYYQVINIASTVDRRYLPVTIPTGTESYVLPEFEDDVGSMTRFYRYVPSSGTHSVKVTALTEGTDDEVDLEFYTGCFNYVGQITCDRNDNPSVSGCSYTLELCDSEFIVGVGSDDDDYLQGRITLQIHEEKINIIDVSVGDHKQHCTEDSVSVFKFTAPNDNFQKNYIFEMYDNTPEVSDGIELQLYDGESPLCSESNANRYATSTTGVVSIPACDVEANKEFFIYAKRDLTLTKSTCFSYRLFEVNPASDVQFGKSLHGEIYHTEAYRYKFNLNFETTNYFDASFTPFVTITIAADDIVTAFVKRHSGDGECDCDEFIQSTLCESDYCEIEMHYCQTTEFKDGDYSLFIRSIDGSRVPYTVTIDNTQSRRLSDLQFDNLYTYNMADERESRWFMYRLPELTEDSYIYFQSSGYNINNMNYYTNINAPATYQCYNLDFQANYPASPPADLSEFNTWLPLCRDLRYFLSFAPEDLSDGSYFEMRADLKTPAALGKEDSLTAIPDNGDDVQYFTVTLDANVYTYFSFQSNVSLSVSTLNGICGFEDSKCTFSTNCRFVVEPCETVTHLKITYSSEYRDVEYVFGNINLNTVTTLTSGDAETVELDAFDDDTYSTSYKAYKIQVPGDELYSRNTLSVFITPAIGFELDSFYFETDSFVDALCNPLPNSLSCCQKPGYYFYVIKGSAATFSLTATITPSFVHQEIGTGSTDLQTDDGIDNYFTVTNTNYDSALGLVDVKYEITDSINFGFYFENQIPNCDVTPDSTTSSVTSSHITFGSCVVRPGFSFSATAPDGSDASVSVVYNPFVRVQQSNGGLVIPSHESRIYYFDIEDPSYQQTLTLELNLDTPLQTSIATNLHSFGIAQDDCFPFGPGVYFNTFATTTLATTIGVCGAPRIYFYINNPTDNSATVTFNTLSVERNIEETSIPMNSATTVDTTNDFLSLIEFSGPISEYEYLYVKVKGAEGSVFYGLNSCSVSSSSNDEEFVIVYTYDDLNAFTGGVDKLFILHQNVGELEIIWNVKQAVIFDNEFNVQYRDIFANDDYVHIYRFMNLPFDRFEYEVSSCNGGLNVYSNLNQVSYSGSSSSTGSLQQNECFDLASDVYVALVSPMTRGDIEQPIQYSFSANPLLTHNNEILVTGTASLNLTLSDLNKVIIYRPASFMPSLLLYSYTVSLVPNTLESLYFSADTFSYDDCSEPTDFNVVTGTNNLFVDDIPVCSSDFKVKFFDYVAENTIDRDTVVVQVSFDPLPFYYQHGIGKVENSAKLTEAYGIHSGFDDDLGTDIYRITHPDIETISSIENYPLDLDILYSSLLKLTIKTDGDLYIAHTGDATTCSFTNLIAENRAMFFETPLNDNTFTLFTTDGSLNYEFKAEYGDFHETIDQGKEYCVELDEFYNDELKFFKLNQKIGPEQYYHFENALTVENSYRSYPEAGDFVFQVDFASSQFGLAQYDIPVFTYHTETDLRCGDYYINPEFLSMRFERLDIDMSHKLRLNVSFVDAQVTTIEHSVNTLVSTSHYKYELPERTNDEPVIVRFYSTLGNLYVGFNHVTFGDCDSNKCTPNAQGYCEFVVTKNDRLDKIQTLYFNAPIGSYIRVEDLAVHSPIEVTLPGVVSSDYEVQEVTNALDYDIKYFKGTFDGSDISVSHLVYNDDAYAFYEYYVVGGRFYDSVEENIAGEVLFSGVFVPKMVKDICSPDRVTIDFNGQSYVEYDLVEREFIEVSETVPSQDLYVVFNSPASYSAEFGLVQVYRNPLVKSDTFTISTPEECHYKTGASQEMEVATIASSYAGQQVNMIARLVTPIELSSNQVYSANSKYYNGEFFIQDMYYFNNDVGSKRIEIVVDQNDVEISFVRPCFINPSTYLTLNSVYCHSSQSECAIETQFSNFPTLTGKVYLSVTTRSNYTIKLVSKSDNCIASRGLPGIGFCTVENMPSSFWVNQDVVSVDTMAVNVYDKLVAYYKELDCDVSDECKNAIKRYACHSTFKSCDTDFGVLRNNDGETCSNVESACGSPLSGLSDSLSCDSSFYEYEGSTDVKVGSSATLIVSLVLAILAIMM